MYIVIEYVLYYQFTTFLSVLKCINCITTNHIKNDCKKSLFKNETEF